MVKFIEKRDGRIVPFDSQKIANAILAAMKDAKEVDAEIASTIADEIATSKKHKMQIEEIQDLVEVKLMEKAKKTAKAYITYRNERSKIRRKNTELNKQLKDKLMCRNIENSNANIDEYSFAGRKNEASNIIQKDLALNEFIRPEIAQAHRENRIYIHDLVEYTIGDSNCLFIDFKHLLANGFTARNGDVRPANSLSTACQQFAVICQISSQQ